jgi:curved DNA-binding protein CbpA
LTNPYKLLKLPATATDSQIETAYNRLFSRYEARAAEGDEAAIAMLERLNEAYDTLSDPDARAKADRSLSDDITVEGRRSKDPLPQSSRTQPQSTEIPRQIKARPRSAYRPRAVHASPRPSRTPYIILGVVAVTALAVTVFLLMSRSGSNNSSPGAMRSTLDSPLMTGDEARRGGIVATVNGRPIYQQDYFERVETDKAIALADPLFSAFVGNFETVTGTRALDILQQDALDRLINLEILQQQAVKEGLFPDANQQPALIEDAKQRDLTGGQTFEQFLQARNISPQQYNRRVIRNLIYAIMANAHMPTTGTSDERTEAFSKWVCDLRRSTNPGTTTPVYDVKINISFMVENPPCTSGLPPDIPLPNIEQEPPEPISTPAEPAETPTPGPVGPPAP